MTGRYNGPDMLEVFTDWSETRTGRAIFRIMQRGLVIGFVYGAGVVINGLLDHDYERAFEGTALVAGGCFLTRFAPVQLELIRAEVPHT